MIFHSFTDGLDWPGLDRLFCSILSVIKCSDIWELGRRPAGYTFLKFHIGHKRFVRNVPYVAFRRLYSCYLYGTARWPVVVGQQPDLISTQSNSITRRDSTWRTKSLTIGSLRERVGSWPPPKSATEFDGTANCHLSQSARFECSGSHSFLLSEFQPVVSIPHCCWFDHCLISTKIWIHFPVHLSLPWVWRQDAPCLRATAKAPINRQLNQIPAVTTKLELTK